MCRQFPRYSYQEVTVSRGAVNVYPCPTGALPGLRQHVSVYSAGVIYTYPIYCLYVCTVNSSDCIPDIVISTRTLCTALYMYGNFYDRAFDIVILDSNNIFIPGTCGKYWRSGTRLPT